MMDPLSEPTLQSEIIYQGKILRLAIDEGFRKLMPQIDAERLEVLEHLGGDRAAAGQRKLIHRHAERGGLAFLRRSYDHAARDLTQALALRDGRSAFVDNPATFPDPGLIETTEEPYIRATIITPATYVGNIISLCLEKRGEQKNLVQAEPTLPFRIQMVGRSAQESSSTRC